MCQLTKASILKQAYLKKLKHISEKNCDNIFIIFYLTYQNTRWIINKFKFF